jgi:branched-chain amino acid transport system substrate-binding protein
VLVVGGLTAWILSRPAPGLPPGPWTIGLDATFSGGSAAFGIPIRNAVEMAVDDANAAGGIGGSQLVLDARDDAGGKNGHDPVKGAANTTTFIADPKSVAMIGPDASNVAAAMIPLTNAAGFFECSPSNSNPRLTKPREGALDLRSAFPDRINYVRLAPADDIQGPALASYVYNDLHATSTLVIDDAGDGRDIADRFTEAYLKFGGTTVRRALNPGSDPSDVLSALDSAGGPMAVFFGGFGDSGAVPLRQAMVAKGHGAIPFVSWDGISGGADDPTSFIANAGPAATGSYYSHAAIAIPKADFVTRYRARFHVEPDEYAPAAYACAQVIFEALTGVAKTGPNAAELREAVRAYAVDITHRYETVIGSVGFDANGDSLQQFVTFYRVDPSAAGGKGDWVIDKQQDYGPAP